MVCVCACACACVCVREERIHSEHLWSSRETESNTLLFKTYSLFICYYYYNFISNRTQTELGAVSAFAGGSVDSAAEPGQVR